MYVIEFSLRIKKIGDKIKGCTCQNDNKTVKYIFRRKHDETL